MQLDKQCRFGAMPQPLTHSQYRAKVFTCLANIETARKHFLGHISNIFLPRNLQIFFNLNFPKVVNYSPVESCKYLAYLWYLQIISYKYNFTIKFNNFFENLKKTHSQTVNIPYLLIYYHKNYQISSINFHIL